MSLSIIIPTVGRPSLRALLERDIVPQLAEGDEVLVVGDGPQPQARAQAEGLDARVRYLEFGPDHYWGHPQRNHAMGQARGAHLMSLDDDDILLPGALKDVRSEIAANPGRPLIFRMNHAGTVLWSDPNVRLANLSTQMFVVPNIASRLGTWGRRYEGDFDFIRSTLDLFPEKDAAAAWCDKVIATHGIGGMTPRREAPAAPMRVVSFYTNEKYKRLSENLRKSVDAIGMPITVYAYPEVARWSDALYLKPQVIRRALSECEEDILYVDADTYFVRKPIELLRPGDWQVAFGWYSPGHPLGCSLAFRNDPQVIAFVDRWIEMFALYPFTRLDETILQFAHLEQKGKMRFKSLTPAYGWDRSMKSRFPGADPVIVHLGAGEGSDKPEVWAEEGSPYK